MLIALDNNKTINAEDAVRQHRYQCPICHELVILKQGNKMASHFAHHAHSDCIGSESESQLHLLGKQKLFNDLCLIYSQLKLEVYLTDLKQRPDLLNDHLAIEYQCSPITNLRLKERVRGYQSKQIKSIWILGMDYFKKNLHSYSVLRFIRYRQTLGYYLLFLDAKNEIYYLKYRIVQINHQISYDQQSFKSYQALLSFINFEQQGNSSITNLIKITELIETKIRWQDAQMLKLQSLCYEQHHLITGCPLIVHYQERQSPVLNRNWLEWKIKIILYLETKQQCNLNELVDLIELDDYLFVAKINPTMRFVKLLMELGYLELNCSKVKLVKSFKWYRDTYDKIDAIKQLEKRSDYDC
ncbi:competence protein CoiA [Fructilactobacillus sp. Tb1]|uniref:competence protein CoiA n=1 Tax=Fructilactobacillus sp. Tb1 TaxID=3422304 RepID=UPI003D27E332